MEPWMPEKETNLFYKYLDKNKIILNLVRAEVLIKHL